MQLPSESKPPYRVPSMDEIRALPWNGLKVASTFSGCGGSCLGYRMAGFRVVWANEFVPAAQDSYKANADPNCVLDQRDIHKVQVEDILAATGLKPGELDLFDGSPPCQAFSTAGKRAKGWGQDKEYEHGAKQKNETLFTEYIRLLRGLRPRAFIAENVSGLIKGVAKGYFLEILAALKASGYRVTCRVLDAQWLGVPQQRQRTIFIGVRDDLGLEPVHPEPRPYRYSVADALPWITAARQETGGAWKDVSVDVAMQPMLAITTHNHSHLKASIAEASMEWPNNGYRGGEILSAGGANDLAAPGVQIARRKFTIAEIKRICAFPDDFVLTGSYSQQWERLGNSVPPVMMRAIAEVVRDKILLQSRS